MSRLVAARAGASPFGAFQVYQAPPPAGDDMSYDWTDKNFSDFPAEDMLGGEMSVAGWADAQTLGADVALDTFATIENDRRLVLAAPDNAGNACGALRNTPSGDFIYACRFGVRAHRIVNHTASENLQVNFVVVDGSNLDDDQWWGIGFNWGADTESNLELRCHYGDAVGNKWDSHLSDTALVKYVSPGMIDALVMRVGTALSFYWSPARQNAWRQGSTYTSGVLAGKIGIRIYTAGSPFGGASTTYVDGFKRFPTSPL